MSASRTHACIETSLAYTSVVQQDRHGVRRSFKTRLHRVVFFVEPGVKINGVYYRDVPLMQKLLPVIRQISGNEFVFQQDSAPVHRAYETIELNAAARLPDKDSKCWRTATASAEPLEQHWTRRHRRMSRIHWPVACATQSKRAFGRQTLWTCAVNLHPHRHTNKQIKFLVDIYWN